MDPALRRFVDATDEAEVEGELNALIEQHALPLAKAIVTRKFRTYRNDKPGTSDVQDREDVIADAMLTLVERLHATRASIDEAPIENFINYAATVIHSTFAHHIRRRYPERSRLKNRLRYVFSTDRRLALWMTGEDELACGLAEWRGRATDAVAARALRRAAELGKRRWVEMSRAELGAAASDLVIAGGGPVDFETFVSAIAPAAGVVEPRAVSDLSVLSSREVPHDVTIDQRRFLARVWNEVTALPVRQRAALLLNLRDATGSGLLWLLPIVGIATIRQIARVLEMPDVDFARLWHDIPLDDVAIGQRLGCTRQQVINLRMAARKRLMNRTGDIGLPVKGRRGPRANLGPVSASLKGSV